jgi:hypothetical protein
MGDVVFRRGDTARVFADENIFHSFWEPEIDLLADYLVLNNVHRDVWVDEAQRVKVDSDVVINLDDVLLAHGRRKGVDHKSYGVGSLIKTKPVENFDTLSCLDMVNDYTVFYLRYV